MTPKKVPKKTSSDGQSAQIPANVSNLETKSEKARESNWTNAEVFDLILLCTDQEWRSKFTNGKKSHSVIWDELAKLLMKQCSRVQAKTKWNALVRDYRNIKKKLKSGDPPPRWPFWKSMKEFLEPRPMQSNSMVIDSLSFELNGPNVADGTDEESVQSTSSGNAPKDHSTTAAELETEDNNSVKRPVFSNRKRKREGDIEGVLREYLQEQREQAAEERVLTSTLITLLTTINSSIQNQPNIVTILNPSSSNVDCSDINENIIQK